MRRALPNAEKVERNRKRYHAEFWPATCEAQGWNPKDEIRRRDVRAACWEAIGRPDKGEEMPGNDAEATALFTYLRHLADPNNITLSMEWDNCRADFIAYNDSRVADFHQDRNPRHARFYHGRKTAAGNPLEDPLSRNEAAHRVIKMRSARKSRAPKPPANPDLVPF